MTALKKKKRTVPSAIKTKRPTESSPRFSCASRASIRSEDWALLDEGNLVLDERNVLVKHAGSPSATTTADADLKSLEAV